MNSEWVRCCETTKENLIYYFSEDNQFHLSDSDEVIHYCPWCGKQLVEPIEDVVLMINDSKAKAKK